MRYILPIVFILNLICFSCKKESFQTINITLKKFGIQHVKADCFPMNDIQHPMAMYEYDQWIIFPNTETTADFPLYLYQKKDLKLAFKWGVFGRGPNELYDCNAYYFEKTDSSFFLNTNYVYESEFTTNGKEIEIKRKEIIAPFPMNNLLKINDSIFFFENRLQKNEYSLYNRKNGNIIKQFSKYPLSEYTYQTMDNRDNICTKSCVIRPTKDSICSFYENLPIIRLYNTKGDILKEVRIQDFAYKINLKDYNSHKSVLYFSYPYATEKYIYVQFFNQPLDEYNQAQSVEIQRWNWDLTLSKRFLIDKYFDIFCVDSQTNILYGVNQTNENSYFIKAVLE